MRIDHDQLTGGEPADSTDVVQALDLAPELAAAQSELAEAKRQFASLVRSLSGLFYRCELQAPWKMSFISDGLVALTGYSAAELDAKNGWAEIMHPADRDAVAARVEEAVTLKRSFQVAYRIGHRDGGTRWVSERGHAVYDAGGAPLFLEGVISDISGRKEAEELQRTLVSRWRTTLDTIPQMVWTMAGDGSDEYYNQRFLDFTGCRVGKGEAASRLDLVHPDDREAAARKWRECLAAAVPYEAQYRFRHASGAYRWVLSRGELERDASGAAVRWYGTCTDIHEQVGATEALLASEALSRSMIEASPDCISLLDMDGNVVFVNAAAREAAKVPDARALVGRPWGDTFPSSFKGPAVHAIRQARGGKRGHFSAAQPTADGCRWWDVIVAPIASAATQQSGIIAIARDITHQKSAEERVRWAANHDGLTLLPNRTLFQKALDQRLLDLNLTGGKLAVLMMDLDDFKRTNDALGHDAGDALLREFSSRIRKVIRGDDVVARLGGDEFAVILRDVGEDDEVEEAVGSILRELRAPFSFDGKLLDIRSSVGASLYPNHGTSRAELLKHADIALYVAKATGRGGLRLFRPEMRAEVQQRMSMLSLAAEALEGDRITPFYQPKFDLRTGRLDGYEALLRWRDADGCYQLPGAIGAAFEDMTLAAAISDRILDLVVADMRRWVSQGVSFGHIAVNAAAAEFRSGDFADKLLERLRKAELPPSLLQLEVTETVFLGRGSEHVEAALRTLASAGVQIALDDFGTGYASLSHLNHFPVSVIKIDRSFISNIEHRSHDAAIVRAVINLGRSLGIKIVAEGVETPGQVAFLRKNRCDFVQGFLFGKAESAEAVAAALADWQQGHPCLPRVG